MLISTNQIQSVLKVYNQQSKVKRSALAEQPAAMSKDKLDFSAESKMVQSVKQYLEIVPDVRQDMVDELQTAVKIGSYHVNGKEIAEKMLGRTVVDRLS